MDVRPGAAIANLVRVPLYPRNSRESHLHMLGHTGCQAIAVADKYATETTTVREELPERGGVRNTSARGRNALIELCTERQGSCKWPV